MRHQLHQKIRLNRRSDLLQCLVDKRDSLAGVTTRPCFQTLETEEAIFECATEMEKLERLAYPLKLSRSAFRKASQSLNETALEKLSELSANN